MKRDAKWEIAPMLATPVGESPPQFARLQERTDLLCDAIVEHWHRFTVDFTEPSLDIAPAARDFSAAQNPSPCGGGVAPELAASFAVPIRLLYEYRADHPGSELRQIFALTQRWEPIIERLVVVGSAECLSAARALVLGAGQPLHNCLSRGERGSKPQCFFVDDQTDNDGLQSLLQLIGSRDSETDPFAPNGTALIVIDDGRSGDHCLTALFHLLQRLVAGCGTSTSVAGAQTLPVALVRNESGRLTGHIEAYLHNLEIRGKRKLDAILQWPRFDGNAPLPGSWNGLGAATTLVAAVMGLDVMQFLEAGLRVVASLLRGNRLLHPAVQLAAGHAALFGQYQDSCRAVIYWQQAWKPLAEWYVRLVSSAFHGDACPPRVMALPSCALESREAGRALPRVIHHLWAHRYRQDVLAIPPELARVAHHHELLQHERMMREDVVARQRIAGQLLTTAELPLADPRAIGHWMQTQIAAVRLEAALRHEN